MCAVPAVPAAMPADQADDVGLLSVVADPMRWRILTLLSGAQLCTTHLQDLLGARQNLVSHHLKVLREAQLVQTEPCGRFTYYRLHPGTLEGLSAALSQLSAASLRDVVRRPC